MMPLTAARVGLVLIATLGVRRLTRAAAASHRFSRQDFAADMAAESWSFERGGRAGSKSAVRCDSASTTVCYADTALTEARDPAMPGPVVGANWILFVHRGDSIELAVSPRAFVATNMGQEHYRDGTTASVYHRRIERDGVLSADITMDNLLGDSVPYELSVRRADAPTPRGRSTGRFATLRVAAASDRTRFSIVPVSEESSVRDKSAWTAFVGAYRVALLDDSLYAVCDVPCKRRKVVKLRPSTNASIRF